MPDLNTTAGLFYENQILKADGLGSFGAGALSDGILTGCDATISGTTVSITDGWAIICGRPVWIEGRTFTLTPKSGTTLYNFYIIKIAVDMQGAATESSFTQATVSVATAMTDTLSDLMSANVYSGRRASSTPGSGRFVYDNDINVSTSNGTASNWLILITTDSGSSPIVKAYNYSVAKSLIKLWENPNDMFVSSTASTFDEQTLTIPEMYAYDGLLITFRGDIYNRSDYGHPFGSMLCPYMPCVNVEYQYTLGMPAMYSTSNKWDYLRYVYINGQNATVRFSNGRYFGTTSSSSNGVIIPAAIYGVKMW